MKQFRFSFWVVLRWALGLFLIFGSIPLTKAYGFAQVFAPFFVAFGAILLFPEVLRMIVNMVGGVLGIFSFSHRVSDDYTPNFDRPDACVARGEYEEAFDLYSKMTRNYPQCARIYIEMLALAIDTMDDLEKGEKIIARAFDVLKDPQDRKNVAEAKVRFETALDHRMRRHEVVNGKLQVGDTFEHTGEDDEQHKTLREKIDGCRIFDENSERFTSRIDHNLSLKMPVEGGLYNEEEALPNHHDLLVESGDSISADFHEDDENMISKTVEPADEDEEFIGASGPLPKGHEFPAGAVEDTSPQSAEDQPATAQEALDESLEASLAVPSPPDLETLPKASDIYSEPTDDAA